MQSKIFAFLAAAFIACSAMALSDPDTGEGNVHLFITTVNATATGGTWQVYMQDNGDNDGLANWDIDVLGSGGAVVNTAPTFKGPRPNDISIQYADGLGGSMGFNDQIFSGTNSDTNRVDIHGGLDTNYGPSDDPTYDMGILVGVGQEPSSASPQNGTQGPTDGSGTPTGIPTPVWNYTPLTTVSGGVGAPSYQIAGTLMEQGTYTYNGQPGATLSVQEHESFRPGDPQSGFFGFIEVLGTQDRGMNEPWTLLNQQGNTPIATVTYDTIPLSVPEPASLGLLGISVGIFNLFGRRTRRHQ